MNERLETQSGALLEQGRSEAGENKHAKAWEEFETSKKLEEFSDGELRRALGIWNRYRVERAGQAAINQGHKLEPKAAAEWVRKIAAGEHIPDKIAFASSDSSQELIDQQAAAGDALAFVEEYREKQAKQL